MTEEKIYKLEGRFNDAFDDAIHSIESGDLTLREVLEFGFNNIIFEGHWGYDEDDFSEDALNCKVTYDYWSTDDDGYRYVCVKRKEEE